MVRHGATDWNSERRFQGHSDLPLNAEGRAQARALAGALQAESFDYAVSSDLSRALETARTICGEGRVEVDPRWREFSFGLWEGLTWDQIVLRWPQSGNREHAAAAYEPIGGETFSAVCDRVGKALEDLRHRSCERALVVTHAGPLHAMLHLLFADRDPAFRETLKVRLTPASITRVRIEDSGPLLIALNETP